MLILIVQKKSIFIFCLMIFLLFFFNPSKAQDLGESSMERNGYRNSVGLELYGRLPLYSISYRRIMGDSLNHLTSFNVSYLGDKRISFSPSYSFVPLTIGIFHFKVGLSSPHMFALWRAKGEEPIPGGRQTPFYEWVLLGVLGTHFPISDRITIDLDFMPRIYSDTPFLSSNDYGRWAHQDAMGGILIAYRF